MATVDEREATEFVLSRMKVVYLVLLDDTPVGYLPTKAAASDYASRLALQLQKTVSLDEWSETSIEEQDNKIRELDIKLKEKIIQERETKEKKSVSAIQDELKILGELYGIDKLSKALKKLNETGESD